MAKKLYIDATGQIEGIYADEFAGLLDHGDAQVTRASHVEPGRDESDRPCWYADLSPSGGPLLGPFHLRQTALDEEVKWLTKELFENEIL